MTQSSDELRLFSVPEQAVFLLSKKEYFFLYFLQEPYKASQEERTARTLPNPLLYMTVLWGFIQARKLSTEYVGQLGCYQALRKNAHALHIPPLKRSVQNRTLLWGENPPGSGGDEGPFPLK